MVGVSIPGGIARDVTVGAVTAAVNAAKAAIDLTTTAVAASNALLDSIDDKLASVATQATLAAVDAKLGGTIRTQLPPEPSSIVTDTFTSVSGGTQQAIPAGAQSIGLVTSGTFVATLQFEFSFDGGTTWITFSLTAPSGTNSPFTATSSSNLYGVANVPPLATHARVRCTAYTSGTAVVRSQFSNRPVTPHATMTSLTSGSSTIGGVFARGVWNDDSVVTLGANATFTGGGRDVLAVAAATAFNAGAAKDVRALAVSDQAGTLHLEISRDNVTFRRIRSVATTAVGSLHVAELQHLPVTRYYRLVYVNGAVAQGHFTLQSIQLAA